MPTCRISRPNSLRPHRQRLLMAAPVGMALLSGCAAPDDFSRPGTWQATGANDTNLRAMLVEPSHAVQGVAAPAERAQPAATAIRRLEQGRRPVLPDSRASTIGPASPAAASPAAEPGNAR